VNIMIRRDWILGGLLALLPAVSQAAILMMVDGVIGPSKVTGYGGWFPVQAINWSIDRSKAAEPHSVAVTLDSSATVATLIQLSATGAPSKKIVFDVVSQESDAALQLHARFSCEDAYIRSSATHADSDRRPVVSLTIQCGRLTWENYDFGTSKAVTAVGKGSWNFRTNTP